MDPTFFKNFLYVNQNNLLTTESIFLTKKHWINYQNW